MAPDPLYARARDIIATDVNGEIVLLDTKSWAYFEFDTVGSSIWTLLEAPHSLPALVEALMQTYEVDRDQCTREAKAFLDETVEQGIVVLG